MGVDSQGAANSPIYSVLAGRVVGGNWNSNGGYGNTVDIDHGGGWTTRYAHFSVPPLVGKGDTVAAGQQIGRMGRTGTGITDVHLHFEVFKNGTNVDPLAYLAGEYGSHNTEDDLTPEQDARLKLIENLLVVPGAGYGWTQVAAQRIQDVQGRIAVPNAGYDYLPALLGLVQSLTAQVTDLQAKVDALKQ